MKQLVVNLIIISLIISASGCSKENDADSGRRIIYTSYSGFDPVTGHGGSDIFTINEYSGNAKALFPANERSYSCPSVAPYGSMIVFGSSRDLNMEGREILMTSNSDGSNLQDLTPDGMSGWAYPCFNPQNKNEVFFLDLQDMNIKKIDVTSKDITSIAPYSGTEYTSFYNYPFKISPDGKYIVLWNDSITYNLFLHSINIETKQNRELFKYTEKCEFCFDKDGKIVFTAPSDWNGLAGIRKIYPDGTGLSVLFEGQWHTFPTYYYTESYSWLRYSINFDKMVYLKSVGSTDTTIVKNLNYAICIADPDGTNEKVVLNNITTIEQPMFSSNGSRIIYVRGVRPYKPTYAICSIDIEGKNDKVLSDEREYSFEFLQLFPK
jgi:Tol biopolymer transport system component